MIQKLKSWLSPSRAEHHDPHYIDESRLPGDALEMTQAGCLEFWRTDQHGVRWYLVSQPDGLSWFATMKNEKPQEAFALSPDAPEWTRERFDGAFDSLRTEAQK